MEVRTTCPSVPEETASEAEEGCEDRCGESAFGNGDVVVADGRALEVGILGETGRDGEEKASEEGQLDQAVRARNQVVSRSICILNANDVKLLR